MWLFMSHPTSVNVDYFEIKASGTLWAQEKLLPPFNYTAEFKLWALPIRLSDITLFDIFIWQGKLLITEQLALFIVLP